MKSVSRLMAQFGVPEPLIVDCPHAIDTARFSASAGADQRRSDTRRELGAG